MLETRIRKFEVKGFKLDGFKRKHLTEIVEATDKASAIIKYLQDNPEYSNAVKCNYNYIR